ncbi:MAG TPA: OsmC family protein [Candidatus Obscuribacterales bacterium]
MARVSVTSQPEKGFRQMISAGDNRWLSDATKDEGGLGENPDPHEYLLGALGTCTAMTLQIFAQRRGWDLGEVEIELSETRVPDPQEPGKHMSAITRDIKVAESLNDEQLQTLRRIADKCPIHKLITGHKTVTTTLASKSNLAASTKAAS